MELKNMLEELTMYYEAAGFADVYEKKLKHKSEDEIRELYRVTIIEKSGETEANTF